MICAPLAARSIFLRRRAADGTVCVERVPLGGKVPADLLADLRKAEPRGQSPSFGDVMEERMRQLEERVMYLEKTLADLNVVVTELNRRVKAMHNEWRDFRAEATPVDENIKPEENVPPHYGPPRER